LFVVLFLEQISLIKRFTKSGSKRNRIEVMAKILSDTKTSCNRTLIFYNCDLNDQQLQLYLDFLLMKRLMARNVDEDGEERFVTTTKGKNFVKNFQALQTKIK
jgi:predicted transcriptional regulator